MNIYIYYEHLYLLWTFILSRFVNVRIAKQKQTKKHVLSADEFGPRAARGARTRKCFELYTHKILKEKKGQEGKQFCESGGQWSSVSLALWVWHCAFCDRRVPRWCLQHTERLTSCLILSLPGLWKSCHLYDSSALIGVYFFLSPFQDPTSSCLRHCQCFVVCLFSSFVCLECFLYEYKFLLFTPCRYGQISK